MSGGLALAERRFRDAISAGEAPPDFPARARAVRLLDLPRGLTMRAQMGTPRPTLLRDAEDATELMLPQHRRAAAAD